MIDGIYLTNVDKAINKMDYLFDIFSVDMIETANILYKSSINSFTNYV